MMLTARPGLGQDLSEYMLPPVPAPAATTPWWQNLTSYWSGVAGRYILRPAPGTAIRTPEGGIYVRQPEGVRQPTPFPGMQFDVGSRVGTGGALLVVAGVGIVVLVMLARRR